MRSNRVYILLLISTTLALASPVLASVSGRRNTALGATGLAIYELARGHTGTGLLAGAGAYYAWSQYNKAHRSSTRRNAYLQGYRAGVQRSYRTLHTSRRYRHR
jgi:hypothetical protein